MAPANTAKLPVVICPGFHESSLTEGFVRSLPTFVTPYIAKDISPTDPMAIHQWLTKIFSSPSLSTEQPLVGIGFSAGVVGLTGALMLWQQQGHRVHRFIAIDGWGVPIVGLPVSRMSHDRFTHMTSLPLGAGNVNFYAEPAVDHLQLWASPGTAQGWQMNGWHSDHGVAMSATDFLRGILQRAWQDSFSWRAAA